MGAQLFDDVFNPERIHEMLFFNIKSVLIYPTLEKLEAENKPLFDNWSYLANSEYISKYSQSISQQTVYEENAINYSEFSKVIAITYATIYMENGIRKRYMKNIVNNDEFIVLATFMDELYQLSTNAIQSTPNYFPILCGYDIIMNDIPFLIKKYIFYRNKFDKKIPLILKRTLSIKPWESGVIDVVNVWKFNGYEKMPLMLIANYLDLKKTIDLLPLSEVSKEYWKLLNSDTEKALGFVSLQSATQTNMILQIMNILTQL